MFTFRVLAVLNKMSTKPQPHNLSLQYENNENLLEIASMKLLRFVKMCEEEIKWGENYIVWWKLFYMKPIHSYVRICVTHFWSLTTSRIAFALWSANGRSTVSLSEAISFLFMLFSSRHIFFSFCIHSLRHADFRLLQINGRNCATGAHITHILVSYWEWLEWLYVMKAWKAIILC